MWDVLLAALNESGEGQDSVQMIDSITRYDKTADSYIGFVLVASIRLWVRHFVNRT